MSKIVKIYCEGKKGSHDYDILEKVIQGISPSPYLEPIGSVTGAGAIIQYKESADIVKSDFKLFFRDRDFDKKVPQSICLEQDQQKRYIYYSYCNTIENYLFDTTCFWQFIDSQGLKEKYQIQNEVDVKKIFVNAAKNIRHYQAIRHTMGAMRTPETDFGTKWTEKSGILPEILDENYCKQKAWEKIAHAKAFVNSWTESHFEAVYQSFMQQFNDTFLDNLDFLIYYQGKDFAASLQLLLPNFPMKAYYKFAKSQFDYIKYPDLIELRTLIQSQSQ